MKGSIWIEQHVGKVKNGTCAGSGVGPNTGPISVPTFWIQHSRTGVLRSS